MEQQVQKYIDTGCLKKAFTIGFVNGLNNLLIISFISCFFPPNLSFDECIFIDPTLLVDVILEGRPTFFLPDPNK